ncbi:MAG TPA: aspartate-semialdehyde dehydrogenase [Gemmatimonadaceae bacterium]
MTATSSPVKRWPVAVLGATGAVGQTFIRQLAGHPWFEIVELAASDRSAGKTYGEACRWLEGSLPTELSGLSVVRCDPEEVASPIVFSALDSGVAGAIEEAFARAGRFVLSNASNHRMDEDVPLVIPEVNAPHLSLLDRQREGRGWPGGIVTNANCAATVAAMALAPLHEAFEVRRAMVFTMQAVSGAGYPGVASLDILGNVIPYIAGEEPKLERELAKMLGSVSGGSVQPATITVSAHTNRVATEHGHLVCLSVEFVRKPRDGEATEVLSRWRGHPDARCLPSSPDRPLVVATEPDRPQTRRDVNAGRGMTVTVGRVRPDALLDLKLVALGHNIIRGAAGGSVLNAELLASRGLLPAA